MLEEQIKTSNEENISRNIEIVQKYKVQVEKSDDSKSCIRVALKSFV